MSFLVKPVHIRSSDIVTLLTALRIVTPPRGDGVVGVFRAARNRRAA
jgi:hypothetical protein